MPRAGFQAERPDSNLFLEQWIPFDMTNMATDDPTALDVYIDFKNGRSGDGEEPLQIGRFIARIMMIIRFQEDAGERLRVL